MIDLTNYIDIQKPIKIRTITSCCLRLDKATMLEALRHDKIYIDGTFYKVPEKTLLRCLTNDIFGDIVIDLEEISCNK